MSWPAGVSVADDGGYELPELPPIPELPAPLPPASVPMGDPDAADPIVADFPIAEGPFRPSWESIAEHYPGEPAWLREAKFGIWVHFGAQAAGESGDWYAKRLYLEEGKYEHHRSNHEENFGHPTESGYKDLLKDWNPDRLDPEALVKLYKEAGARFLLIQGVHHDNFDNWDSRYQPWNSVNLGPRRDLLREWTDAAREEGLRYGVAFHHEYTWWWYQTAFGSDTSGPRAGIPYDGHLTLADGAGRWWEGYDPRMLYTVDLREYQGLDVEFAPLGGIFTRHRDYAEWYVNWWALRILDVIENYDPDFIYTDGNSTQPFSGRKSGTGAVSDAAQRVIAHYYNRTLRERGGVDTFSVVKFHPPAKGVVSTREGRFPAEIKRDQPWIGEVAVGDWFYAPGFHYDAGALVRHLLEVVSRDGSVCANIPLKPDGSLDEGSRRLLEEVGEWLARNGEGIYGSRAWRVFGEDGGRVDDVRVAPGGHLGRRQADMRFSGDDFRFTQGEDGAVYAFCLGLPAAGDELEIVSLGKRAGLLEGEIGAVELLGHDGELDWSQHDEALRIRYPHGAELPIAAGFRVRLVE